MRDLLALWCIRLARKLATWGFTGDQRAARELYKLSDRQLKDIGLTRGDLDNMIKERE